jgi:hypothetical protein
MKKIEGGGLQIITGLSEAMVGVTFFVPATVGGLFILSGEMSAEESVKRLARASIQKSPIQLFDPPSVWPSYLYQKYNVDPVVSLAIGFSVGAALLTSGLSRLYLVGKDKR